MISDRNNIILILWTCASLEEARSIGRELVEKKCIACANLIPHVESIYLWEEKIQNGNEVKVFMKTTDAHFEAVREYIKNHCTYDVPEVSQISIKDGNPDYFRWVQNTVVAAN